MTVISLLLLLHHGGANELEQLGALLDLVFDIALVLFVFLNLLLFLQLLLGGKLGGLALLLLDVVGGLLAHLLLLPLLLAHLFFTEPVNLCLLLLPKSLLIGVLVSLSSDKTVARVLRGEMSLRLDSLDAAR